MKKFLAGFVVSTILISCIAVFVVVPKIIPKIISDPIKTAEQIITPGPVEVAPDTTALVKEVQLLARLETASLDLIQVFPATRDNKRFGGIFGEELTFIANGKAIAGVDLNYVEEKDFQVVDNHTIKINLPKAKIFNVIIDNNTSYVACRSKGLLATADPQLETEVRITAQNKFEEIVLKSDLLNEANKNAQNIVRGLAQKIGFTTVVFTNN
jgi:hypothetical protein